MKNRCKNYEYQCISLKDKVFTLIFHYFLILDRNLVLFCAELSPQDFWLSQTPESQSHQSQTPESQSHLSILYKGGWYCDGMAASPLYLKDNSDGMATSPL